LKVEQRKRFSNKKFLILIGALTVCLLIDTSIVQINDLVDKYFIPMWNKVLLFSVNSSVVILLQFIAVRYVTNSFKIDRVSKSWWVNRFYLVSISSLCLLASLVGSLVFGLIYFNDYHTAISISIIAISYGTAASFIMWLAFLFFSWYKSSHNLVVFLYFFSMSLIALNLIIGAGLACANIASRPSPAGEYGGASADITSFKFKLLNNISNVTSFISFFSIWLTTGILTNSYRERLIRSVFYWILLSLPFAYFLITYFYQFIFANLLISYLEVDPVSVSIALGTFLSLSKPIGGLVFGISLWSITKIISYEKNIRTSMIMAGLGILLIFSANQAATQIVGPYPPFGLATVTILVVASYIMLLGIYNSAKLVSVNNDLRHSIHNHALKLLSPIGKAQMEKEIQKTVKQISNKKEVAAISIENTTETTLEWDEDELKKYVRYIIKEVRKR
jgi:hypothetical protein